MSDFKAKMHQIVCRLGLCPRPRWRAYSAPPGTGVQGGHASKGRARDERGRERNEEEGRRRRCM